MGSLLEDTLDHLRHLVAFDTQNPPRAMSADGVFAYLERALGPAFTVAIDDLGDGCVNLYAVRGAPKLLFNFHIDTVPKNPAWTRDPFELVVEGDRAVGLGACDIKGAAAAMLAAVACAPGDVALLFSSDEEAGQGRCVRRWLEQHGGEPLEGVVVAEPTRGQAVLAHRGIGTGTMVFEGRPGHASSARALKDSAVHEAVRWGARALERAEHDESVTSEGLSGLRLNLGRIEGGEKPNMIAAECRVRFGVRPPPGLSPKALLEELAALTDPKERARLEPGFLGPTLPAQSAQLDEGRALARRLSLEEGSAVDFWTEASLFSDAGHPALVYGPGDIAQAHTADEWVRLAELESAAATYLRVLGGGHDP